MHWLATAAADTKHGQGFQYLSKNLNQSVVINYFSSYVAKRYYVGAADAEVLPKKKLLEENCQALKVVGVWERVERMLNAPLNPPTAPPSPPP